MTDINFTILKDDPALTLSASERAQMREALSALTLAAPMPLRHASSPFLVFFMHPMPLAALALILTVSLGGVSFAAEGALPGDALYTVKVAVNEKVETALAPTNVAKASVAVRHAEERIRETEVLAAKGTLSDEVAVAAAESVDANVASAAASADALTEAGDDSAADGIRTRITAALSAHAELLDAQADAAPEGAGSALRGLSLAIAATAEEDATTTGDDETTVAIAEEGKARAKATLSDLEKVLDKDGVADESAATLSDEFAQLSEKFNDAEGLLDAHEYEGATQAYEDIEKGAYRAIALLGSAKDIGDATGKDAVITVAQAPAPVEQPHVMAKMMAMTLALPQATTSMDASSSEDEAMLTENQTIAPKIHFELRNRLKNR